MSDLSKIVTNQTTLFFGDTISDCVQAFAGANIKPYFLIDSHLLLTDQPEHCFFVDGHGLKLDGLALTRELLKLNPSRLNNFTHIVCVGGYATYDFAKVVSLKTKKPLIMMPNSALLVVELAFNLNCIGLSALTPPVCFGIYVVREVFGAALNSAQREILACLIKFSYALDGALDASLKALPSDFFISQHHQQYLFGLFTALLFKLSTLNGEALLMAASFGVLPFTRTCVLDLYSTPCDICLSGVDFYLYLSEVCFNLLNTNYAVFESTASRLGLLRSRPNCFSKALSYANKFNGALPVALLNNFNTLNFIEVDGFYKTFYNWLHFGN